MAAPVEEHIRLLKACFDPETYERLEISGSFRVTLDCGHQVYIYPETADNAISARVEIQEGDPGRRAEILADLHARLAAVLSFASVESFRLARQFPEKRAYTARIRIAGIASDTPASARQASGAPGKGENPFSAAADREGLFDAKSPGDAATEPASLDELQELLGMLDPARMKQQLDWMYVAPDSLLRSAFAKIRRSRGDSGELEAELRMQVQKLAGSRVAYELELARHINADMLFQPFLNLLCRLVCEARGDCLPGSDRGRISL